MVKDGVKIVKRCDSFKRHAPSIKLPSRYLTGIYNHIPFAQWGMDIIGPFKQAYRKKSHVIVAMDYFTKWVEVGLLLNLSAEQVHDFIWKTIITRFGLPRVTVFDRGTQFVCTKLWKFLDPLGVKVAYASVCNPKSNGPSRSC